MFQVNPYKANTLLRAPLPMNERDQDILHQEIEYFVHLTITADIPIANWNKCEKPKNKTR